MVMTIDIEALKALANDLKLVGLQAHWHNIDADKYPWLEQWLSGELVERKQRTLERRLSNAKLGRFKPLSEFDNWKNRTGKDFKRGVHRAKLIVLL